MPSSEPPVRSRLQAQRSAAAAMVKASQPPRLPVEGPWLAGPAESRGRAAEAGAAADVTASGTAGSAAAAGASSVPEAMPMTAALRSALQEATAAAALASAQLADRKL